MADALTATVTLQRQGVPRVALARAALLEAIAQRGSIRAAAEDVGLSYKAAWDAVQALNNLFDDPLVTAAPGGRTGGAATVTPHGQAVLQAFRRVQTEIDAALAKLDDALTGAPPADLFWSLGMKTSARNALRGQIRRIVDGVVSTEVTLHLGGGLEIVSVITRQSAQDLQLAIGDRAIALIKSSFIILAKGEGLRTSARNQIAGHVVSRDDGPVNCDVRLDIGAGKTLAVSLTTQSATMLDLAVGDAVTALVKAPHVILAIE